MKKSKKILLTSLLAISSVSAISAAFALNANQNNKQNDIIASFEVSTAGKEEHQAEPFDGQEEGQFTVDTANEAKDYYTALYDKILEIVNDQLTSTDSSEEWSVKPETKENIINQKTVYLRAIDQFKPYWDQAKNQIVPAIDKSLKVVIDAIFKKETKLVEASLDYPDKKTTMFNDATPTKFIKNYTFNLKDEKYRISKQTENNEVTKNDKYASWTFRNQLSLIEKKDDLNSKVFNDFVIKQKVNVVTENDGGIFTYTEEKLSIDEFKDLEVETKIYEDLLTEIEGILQGTNDEKFAEPKAKLQETLDNVKEEYANMEFSFDNPKTFQTKALSAKLQEAKEEFKTSNLYLNYYYKLQEFKDLNKENPVDAWIFDEVQTVANLNLNEQSENQQLIEAYNTLNEISKKYVPVKTFNDTVNTNTSNNKIKELTLKELASYLANPSAEKLQEIKDQYLAWEVQWVDTFETMSKIVANDNISEDQIKQIKNVLVNELPNIKLTKEIQQLTEQVADLKTGKSTYDLKQLEFTKSSENNRDMLDNLLKNDENTYKNSFWLLMILVVPVLIIPAMIFFFVNKRNKKDKEEK
ncbi:hypothetical protein KQ875_02185 [Mycoplasma zalophi]|uniref:Uncharacterized protein n=1 Tax=Mycoplasma zalophi TaxID=191287 RepID=A0ABS6DPZ6_9MOLU|nr:hypothetical protein [Mycoplasma zalophi]MBU4692401.1 hypothetical protein [Mycoplasma zalophi]